MNETDRIRIVDIQKADMTSFTKHLADCVILTHDCKLLMQYRPPHWGSAPDCLNIFGGHIDEGETVMEALVRELNEELGAIVLPEDVVVIGSISEACYQHKELVHVHFWHDRHATITGCYEAEDRRFDTAEEALAHPKIAEYAYWAIQEAQKRGLLKMAGLQPDHPPPPTVR